MTGSGAQPRPDRFRNARTAEHGTARAGIGRGWLGLGRNTAAASALACALPGLLTGLALNPHPGAGGLLNPDSAMRMVRLHDILAAGAPLHAVMRDGSGAGTLLHWSHLLDSLLLLLAAPAAALVGWQAALHGAALLVGPLMLAGLGLALAWAAAPYAPRGWAWVAAAAAGVVPSVGGYGMTGVVHHHVLLAVAVVMAGGWAARLVGGIARPASGGLALGAWAGTGLWLSPETLPFSLMAIGALWLAWLMAPGGRMAGSLAQALAHSLAACGAGFSLVTAAAWLADPPAAGWWAAEPDRISLPFVVLAGATLLCGLLALWRCPRPVVLACGLASAAAWLTLFPQVLRGTEALLPREVVHAMFDGIEEMEPVSGIRDLVGQLLGGWFAIGVLALLMVRRPGWLPAYALACTAGLVALATLHVRFATYPAVAGAALVPLALAWIGRTQAAASVQSLTRMGVVLPLLLLPMLMPGEASAGAEGTEAPVRCPLSGAASLLRPYPGAVVLSGVNEVPELLYRTEARTVGSLYHRSPDGFMRLRAAWRSMPRMDAKTADPAVRATAASLVLVCPGAARSSLVGDLPQATLLDRLQAGQPPAWLRRVADAGRNGYVLYAVAP